MSKSKSKINKIKYEGETFSTVDGNVKVITYTDARNILVQFLTTGSYRKVRLQHLKEEL